MFRVEHLLYGAPNMYRIDIPTSVLNGIAANKIQSLKILDLFDTTVVINLEQNDRMVYFYIQTRTPINLNNSVYAGSWILTDRPSLGYFDGWADFTFPFI
jgi:hypothetical protein